MIIENKQEAGAVATPSALSVATPSALSVKTPSELSIATPNIDIGKIIIGIVEEIKKDFLNKPEIKNFEEFIKKIKESIDNLDIDNTIINTSKLAEQTLKNATEAFLEIMMSNIKKKVEDNNIRIRNKLLEKNKTPEEINKIFNILQQLSDFSELKNLDLFNFNLLDLKKITEQIILKKLNLMGITREEEISKVLEKLIHKLIGETIDTAVISAPITIAQALASIWPLGSEPLVAVNKLDEIITQTTEIVIDTVMDGTVDAIETNLIKGGRRKKKRKSKSKHFYINRIKRTLKYFYNY